MIMVNRPITLLASHPKWLRKCACEKNKIPNFHRIGKAYPNTYIFFYLFVCGESFLLSGNRFKCVFYITQNLRVEPISSNAIYSYSTADYSEHLIKYNARNGMNLNPYYGTGMVNLIRVLAKCTFVCYTFVPVCVCNVPKFGLIINCASILIPILLKNKC